MAKKKAKRSAPKNTSAKRADMTPMEAFTHQDPNDPRTYAGRKRERVRLGGIGDDGLVMTHARMNMHRTFNAYYIWGVISIAVGVIIAAASFFQGGTIDGWTMVSTGGAIFNGYELPTLMRLEALYCIISGAIFFGGSFVGFAWLYDGGIVSTARKWSTLNTVLALIWIAASLALVQVIEPVSIVSFILLMLYFKFSTDTERERNLETAQSGR